MKQGTIIVNPADMEGFRFTSFEDWNKFVPKGTRATEVFFVWDWDDYDDIFYAVVKWVKD